MKTLLQLYKWQFGLSGALLYIAWPHLSTVWTYYMSSNFAARALIESSLIVAVIAATIALTLLTIYRDQQPGKARRPASQ